MVRLLHTIISRLYCDKGMHVSILHNHVNTTSELNQGTPILSLSNQKKGQFASIILQKHSVVTGGGENPLKIYVEAQQQITDFILILTNLMH